MRLSNRPPSSRYQGSAWNRCTCQPTSLRSRVRRTEDNKRENMNPRHIWICAALAMGLSNALQAQIPPVAAPDQLALLKSSDPKLAANNKLVFDMYRAIVQGGHTEMAEQYFTPGYIQHNPNVVSGRDALVKYIKQTRPAVPLKPLLDFPVISVMAEGDMVTIAVVS